MEDQWAKHLTYFPDPLLSYMTSCSYNTDFSENKSYLQRGSHRFESHLKQDNFIVQDPRMLKKQHDPKLYLISFFYFLHRIPTYFHSKIPMAAEYRICKSGIHFSFHLWFCCTAPTRWHARRSQITHWPYKWHFLRPLLRERREKRNWKDWHGTSKINWPIHSNTAGIREKMRKKWRNERKEIKNSSNGRSNQEILKPALSQ